MELRIDALTIDSPDPEKLARFYERILGWARTYEDDGEIVIEDPDGGGIALLFIEGHDPKQGKNRLHFDLRPDDQEAAVEFALKFGATEVDIGQHEDPDVTWVVLADPDGNEFCILRAQDEPSEPVADDEGDETEDYELSDEEE